MKFIAALGWRGSFLTKQLALRLVSAILMEIDDAWQAGKVYLTFEREDEMPQS